MLSQFLTIHSSIYRCNKAEGLAVGLSDMKGITNLYDADFTCKIFRFLQLLCEGHNLGEFRLCTRLNPLCC